MKWELTLSTAAALGALAWLAGAPRSLTLGETARFERPLVRAGAVDEVERLVARLEHASGLMLFPAAVLADAAAVTSPAAGSLRLLGTAISPGRRAALVAVDGAAAKWIAVGEAGDLQLLELSDTRAVLRTSSGEVVTLDLFKTPETVANGAVGAND